MAVSTLTVVGICELLVRALYRKDVVLYPRYHAAAQYGHFQLRRLRPNFQFWHTSIDGSWRFTTNSRGFRGDREITYEKPDDCIRVICLGDSHTLGFEVRQDFTYARAIEKYLQRRGNRVEVINAGVSGFSTAEALAFLENEGIKYDPDFVVLGFFANDIEDNLKADLFRLVKGHLVVQRTRYLPGVRIQELTYRFPLTKWLGENSYFYSMAFNAAWEYAKEWRADAARELLDADRNEESARAEDREYAISMKDEYSEYELTLAAKLLERLFQVCQDNDAQLLVLDIPQVEPEGDRIGPSLPLRLAVNASEFCHHFVSSMTALSEYTDVAELHVPHGQRHISEFTHTVLGVHLAQRIESELARDKPGIAR